MKRLAAAFAGMLALFLTACGAKEFDAKGYVQGTLDAQLHGEYAAHAEDIGQTAEEVRKQIEDENLETAKDTIGDTGFPASDEEIQAYMSMLLEGMKQIQYEVKDAVKDENGNYTVDVAVTPVGLLDGLEPIFTAKLTDAVNQGIDESGYMAVLNESVKESISQAKTYEPETVKLNVAYAKDGKNRVYTLNESDLDALIRIATHQD